MTPAEDRRQALVLAAYNRLAEQGFEGLRTRDVAAAVGVNIATLHYYFPTKEALVRAVVAHAMGRFASTLSAGVPAGDQLRAHFRGVRRLRREEPELFAVMGELALRSARDPAVAAIFQATTTAWRSALRAMLERARTEGHVGSEIDAEATADVVIATLKGLYMLPAAGSKSSAERALAQLEGLLTRG